MNKFLSSLAWLIMLIPAVYLALVWQKIPGEVVLHFDWSGKPDQTGSRKTLITTITILIFATALVYLVLSNIYRIDPKKHAPENKDRLKKLALGVVVFMTALLCMIIFSASHGNIRFNTGLILAGMGILFAFIGNYMHALKPNYFAGFRLPWTLENEVNWKKTHALAGKLWFGGGISLAIICLFLPSRAAMAVFFAVMIGLTAIPIIYSYRLFVKSKRPGGQSRRTGPDQ